MSGENIIQRPGSSPRLSRGSHESNRPPAKRTRSTSGDKASRPSSSSSRGSSGAWTFTHGGPGSVLDDNWGLATLMRHMKQVGCPLPAVNNLRNREGYLDVAFCMGQLANAINRSALGYKNMFHDFPDVQELEDVKVAFQEEKNALDLSQSEVQKLQAKLGELSSQLEARDGKVADLGLELKVKGNRILAFEGAKRTIDAQVSELISANRDLMANKEDEVRRVIRIGKKEMIEAYQKVLNSIKDKFKKKKDEVSAQIYAQEIQANIELLAGLISQEIKSVQEEHERLVALFPSAIANYDKSLVSHFSVSRLPLPQLSDSLGLPEAAAPNPAEPNRGIGEATTHDVSEAGGLQEQAMDGVEFQVPDDQGA